MRDLTHHRDEAARFRNMAMGCDETTSAALIMLAEHHEEEADRLGAQTRPPLPTLD